MARWKRVKWTEARQIAELLDWEGDLGGRARDAPEDYFASLRQAGRLSEAVMFLSQALPRYETVAWAVRAVRDLAPGPETPGPDGEALKATLLWVQDPSDARRRAAFEAAGRTKRNSPEKLAALAAFFSGGSVTPEDCPPTPPPNNVAGRFAAGAVLLAAIRTGDGQAGMSRALDFGAQIAERGLEPAPP
ncbi:MAG: DUF6931 family protein [Caulobacteraceae bacterium]